MKKYDLVLVDLNPTKGSEQMGIRPCIVLQNNAINASKLRTVTIAPLTSTIKILPWALVISPDATNNIKARSRIELSQIRTIDRERIIQTLGKLDKKHHAELHEKLALFFDVVDRF